MFKPEDQKFTWSINYSVEDRLHPWNVLTHYRLPTLKNSFRLNQFFFFWRLTIKCSCFMVVIFEMYQVISSELPHWTSLQVLVVCIPDKTFAFSVTIMQSSFSFYSHIFTFSFSSLYPFNKQTLFLHACYAMVGIFQSA